MRAGEELYPKPGPTAGLLTTASDQRLEVDLCKQLIFPAHIVPSLLLPDIVIVSESSKQLITLEFTVP